MTISERDRKILMLIIPLVVLAGYWFLILGPKRDEASVAADELAQQEARLDTAEAAAEQAKSAENASSPTSPRWCASARPSPPAWTCRA